MMYYPEFLHEYIEARIVEENEPVFRWAYNDIMSRWEKGSHAIPCPTLHNLSVPERHKLFCFAQRECGREIDLGFIPFWIGNAECFPPDYDYYDIMQHWKFSQTLWIRSRRRKRFDKLPKIGCTTDLFPKHRVPPYINRNHRSFSC